MDHLQKSEPASTPTESDANKRPPILTLDEKTMLKIVCNTPTDLADARKYYEWRRESYVDSLSRYQREKASVPPVGKCVAELSERNFGLLIYRATHSIHLGLGDPEMKELLDEVSGNTASGGFNRREMINSVTKYCTSRAAIEPTKPESPWYYFSRKQIFDALQ